MPEFNIEEKIQEALKKKSFKENKSDYIGLSLIYCIILFITFLICYRFPLISFVVFILVDIPVMMGFKHFIWFGPASGETLIEGFKVSMICGYLNFTSYVKIFLTTNLKPLLLSFLAFFLSILAGSTVMEFTLKEELEAIMSMTTDITSLAEVIEAFNGNPAIRDGINTIIITSSIVSLLVFYIAKINRSLIPYVSFLRLTSVDGKSMDGIISHSKKMLKAHRWDFYLKTTLYHLLYIIPFALFAITYKLLSLNPVYSILTLELISALIFFVALTPAVLFVELNYRTYCINTNQEFAKERREMLNDAINDLNN